LTSSEKATDSKGKDSMTELLEVKPEVMGIQMTGYVGAFPPQVARRIGQLAEHPILHLFSGTSLLGDERIDLAQPNATKHMDVLEFVQSDERDWKFLVADPPYEIDHAQEKLFQYAARGAVSASVPLRTAIERYARKHVENILWFDICVPPFRGFELHQVWLYRPMGWAKIRALSWFKRQGERLA
jgi:hypothetical protein